MFKRAVVVVVGLLLVWQLLVWALAIPTYFLPGPCLVFTTLYDNVGLLAEQAWPTILETLLGFALALLWGGAAAIGMSLWQPVRFWLLPMLVLSQAIPTIAIAPLLIVWLGYGVSSKIAVILLSLFFPVTAAFYDGLRRTDPAWLDMAAVMQASKWRTLRYIRLPAALPALASGLRVAAAWAPMAAVIGEWVGASRGLGFLMLNANARLDIPLMFAALLVLITFTLLFYFIIDQILTKTLPWQAEK